MRREDAVAWSNPQAILNETKALRALGFADCGIRTTPRMAGIKIWFWLHEPSGVAAFLYEHPKTGNWVELSVRYDDGTTTSLSTHAPTGIDHAPPFFRKLLAEPGTPAAELYARILRDRSPEGIKKLTAQSVVEEHELSYAKLVA